jgi:hypothetical protein
LDVSAVNSSTSNSTSTATSGEVEFQFDQLSILPLRAPRRPNPPLSLRPTPAPAPAPHPQLPFGHVFASVYHMPTQDVELMHHYYNSTSLYARDVSKWPSWQNFVPQEGVKHPYVLESLLSFSALHIASLNKLSSPDRKDFYSQLAMRHQGKAYAAFCSQVRKIEPGNCDAVVMFSALAVLYEVCMMHLQDLKDGHVHVHVDMDADLDGGEQKGSGSGKENDAIDALLRLFMMLRNLVRMWSSCAHWIIQGNVARLLMKPGRIDTDARVADRLHTALAKLEITNQERTQNGADREIYSTILGTLITLSEIVVRFPDDWAPVMRWSIPLPERFIQLLKDKEPLALVILAHYCIIVHFSQKWWCMRGWSEMAFEAVVRRVGDGWWESLDWAVESMVFNRSFVKSVRDGSIYVIGGAVLYDEPLD